MGKSVHLAAKRIKLLQKIGWLVLRPILVFFTDYKLCAHCDIKQLRAPFIIVSNHVSYLDPPIIGSILPFNSGVYPVYFLGRDKMLSVPVLGGFLKLLGAFRARKGEGIERSLLEPKRILRQGSSVVLFPQGHRFPEFRAEQGRRGVAFLALASGKPILPMAICGVKHFSWKKFFLRQYRVRVIVGRPFYINEKFSGLKPEADQVVDVIMREIGELLKS